MILWNGSDYLFGEGAFLFLTMQTSAATYTDVRKAH